MPDNRTYYAHSLPNTPPNTWQPLEEHLTSVASLAAEFAKPFGGEEWARLAGLWHDLGKYSEAFQKRLYDANGFECHLETTPGRVIHSAAGGHLAQHLFGGGVERILCWLIMGHHAGLADFESDDSGARALEPKMRRPAVSTPILANVPESIKNQNVPAAPSLLLASPPGDVATFVRMIFSCVVDADFLDTEAFMNKGRGRLREQERPALGDLLASFDSHMNALCGNARPTHVNTVRAEVLAQCRAKAEECPGVFSLTVPTGGGKTLSSLAFALRHAVRWNKRRIIYVIPYTSIIEQTADVFRGIPRFADAVLEHHSNIADDEESTESVRRRLAAENWDSPIIVTTAVQFFESLYACKTSRCRKLHNIVNSVVIFDEAQCLPPEYLRPCVFAIRELRRHYGVTPVLCTATQPVLTATERFDFRFKEGFDEAITEIVSDPGALSRKLKRVTVSRHADLTPVGLADLAEAIRAHAEPVLCIVNRKRDCRELARLLPEERTVHLSTNMCAAQRLHALGAVRKRIESDEAPLYVISTSLVEAGVDLDFPIVYRALAGLDSIAQAAGRCNREGKRDRGRTFVFLPESQPDYVAAPSSLARQFLSPEQLNELFLPNTFTRYFRLRFFQLGSEALDQKRILTLLGGNLDFNYRKAAEAFRLIDDTWQQPLIVPYGEGPGFKDRLLDWDARNLFRRLQRYTISVPKHVMRVLLDQDYAHELAGYPGTCYLHTQNLYSDRFGFIPPMETEHYDPESTIV